MTMNIKAFILCCTIVIAYASDETKQILTSFQNMTADYSLQTYNKKHQLAFKDHGTLYVNNLTEFKFSSTVNKGSFIMLKDNYIWQYDNDLQQLVQMDLSSKPTALDMLEHINDYSQKKVIAADGYYLYLTHAKMPELKLYVEDDILTSVEFYDNFGYMNKILFANILSDTNIPKDTFVFMPSSDVEIIKQ